MDRITGSTYERARRRQAYRRLARLIRRSPRPADLLPLDEVSRRLRAFEQSYLGIMPIEVSKIVGTVDRAGEFDRDFLPRRRRVEDRWRRVEEAFPEGDFPPIQVYRLGEAYFVIDGHHRVAIARQRRMSHIDAEVTELRSRWRLPADADLGRIIHAEQERIFMEESGLERARPEARIEFTRAQGYIQLLENVKVHGYHLMQERGEVLPPEEVAADWYDRVYRPTVEAIRRENLLELYPTATEGDLFLWVYQRLLELFPERGGMGYEDVIRAGKDEPPPAGRTRRVAKRLKGQGAGPPST
ncbi:MAG: hypothetical protein ACRDIZ_03900 [Actinomycetota bacterium]